MFDSLKAAFLDPKFHKDLIQKVALSIVVSAVTAVAQQGFGVVASEIRTKIEESQAVTVIPTESAQ